MSKLGKALRLNTETLRIRSFDYNGQQFKVLVPLATEAEAMFARAENPPEESVAEKYETLSKDLISRKEEILETEADIQFTEDDIVVGGKSLKNLAKQQAGGEVRILESFKLLIGADGKPLEDITYEEIQEEFPLPVQLSLVKAIAETISPSYEDVKKN